MDFNYIASTTGDGTQYGGVVISTADDESGTWTPVNGGAPVGTNISHFSAVLYFFKFKGFWYAVYPPAGNSGYAQLGPYLGIAKNDDITKDTWTVVCSTINMGTDYTNAQFVSVDRWGIPHLMQMFYYLFETHPKSANPDDWTNPANWSAPTNFILSDDNSIITPIAHNGLYYLFNNYSALPPTTMRTSANIVSGWSDTVGVTPFLTTQGNANAEITRAFFVGDTLEVHASYLNKGTTIYRSTSPPYTSFDAGTLSTAPDYGPGYAFISQNIDLFYAATAHSAVAESNKWNSIIDAKVVSGGQMKPLSSAYVAVNGIWQKWWPPPT